MARKFETSAIIDPVTAPVTGRSLEHINSAYDELGSQLARTLISSYTTNDVVILYGCVVTANIPGTSSVTAGAIYYNGRIYSVDTNASISSPSNTLVWSIATTYIAGDPATFSDGSINNFHQIQKFQLTNAVSGSGIADYNAATVRILEGQRRGDLVSYQTGWANAGSNQFVELPLGDIEYMVGLEISTGGTGYVGDAPTWAIPKKQKRFFVASYNGTDGSSELCMLTIETDGKIFLLKQSDGTKPSSYGGFIVTVRYNIF